MKVTTSPEQVGELKALRSESKFQEEDFYPGAPTEEIRIACEARVNEFIDQLLALLAEGADREAIDSLALELSGAFWDEDTEEQEKVEDYVAEAMAILGMNHWSEEF